MTAKTACILLAAGLSSRMRGQNKLLMRMSGETMIRKSAQVVQQIPFQEIVTVVAESSANPLLSELKDFPFTIAQVSDPSIGMHASIRKGIENLKSEFDAFLIYLADQPLLDPTVIQKLISAYPSGNRNQIVYPTVRGERVQPVLIGADFIPEILAHADGDFGCAYLIKKYPERCHPVPFTDATLFLDFDTPEAFQKIQIDPVEAFYELGSKLRHDRKPYVVATVISVVGSASARTGSKAIFDEHGKNLLGWVGGGCAEQHVSQQSLEALRENRTRIIEADLEDEIFGLGVACGGKMKLFLEPVHPAEAVRVQTQHPAEAEIFGRLYGWKVEVTPKKQKTSHANFQDLIQDLTQAISSKRKKDLTSLRSQRDLQVNFDERPHPSGSKRVTLVGATRITESLERHFNFLGFQVRTVGPLLKPYGEEEGPEISFEPGERVIVASHTAQDPHILSKVLKQPVAYAAMVGSRKRALEVLALLEIEKGAHVSSPLFVPAGFDIDAKNPDEVALSIVAECLVMAPTPHETEIRK